MGTCQVCQIHFPLAYSCSVFIDKQIKCTVQTYGDDNNERDLTEADLQSSNRLIKKTDKEDIGSSSAHNPLMTAWRVYSCFYTQQPPLGGGPFCK